MRSKDSDEKQRGTGEPLSERLEQAKTPFTRAQKIGTARQIFGTVPRLPVPRLPPGGSLGTPKILSTGATLHLRPIDGFHSDVIKLLSQNSEVLRILI